MKCVRVCGQCKLPCGDGLVACTVMGVADAVGHELCPECRRAAMCTGKWRLSLDAEPVNVVLSVRSRVGAAEPIVGSLPAAGLVAPAQRRMEHRDVINHSRGSVPVHVAVRSGSYGTVVELTQGDQIVCLEGSPAVVMAAVFTLVQTTTFHICSLMSRYDEVVTQEPLSGCRDL